MAKKGQHKNDAFDQTKSPGHNNPKQSMTNAPAAALPANNAIGRTP